MIMEKANSYEEPPRSSYANETKDPRPRDHKLVKEDHNFLLAQQNAEQNFQNSQLKIKIGRIGGLLGCEDNASRNITALICAILLIILLVSFTNGLKIYPKNDIGETKSIDILVGFFAKKILGRISPNISKITVTIIPA